MTDSDELGDELDRSGEDEYPPDPDQPGEELDESLGGEYPPDRPPQLDDDGGTEPEVWERAAEYDDDGGVDLADDPDVEVVDDEAESVSGAIDDEPELVGGELLGDPDAVEEQAESVGGVVDDEPELIGGLTRDEPDAGPLAPDDEISGDESTRDVATERVPGPAEDAAVHVDDEPPDTAP